MPKYLAKNATAKAGVNFVRSIVEGANSIFNEIHQENDIGIDAIIELIDEETSTGKCIAVQIKSGESFFDHDKGRCTIPVKSHRDYWRKYSLPVFGIVYIPSKGYGYWVDIKKYLDNNDTATTISFECNRISIFNVENFEKFLFPYFTGNLPTFSYEMALDLLRSNSNDEAYVGLVVLFRNHNDNFVVWDEFVNYFRRNRVEDIRSSFVYYLAHIPWHGDIFGGKDKITDETREYAASLIHSFDKIDVVKLLSMITEAGIDRGTVGQSVEAIISSIPQRNKLLISIIEDRSVALSVREWATLLYAYYNGRTSVTLLARYTADSASIKMVVTEVEQHGAIRLY